MNILITGATSGIGEAMVSLFANKGHQIVAIGRREDRLESLRQKFGNQVLALNLDIRDQLATEKSLSSVIHQLGRIDVLVNNAGLALGVELAQNASINDWKTMVDTNINGLLYCTYSVLPYMVKQNSGHIINIGSVAGEFPYPGGNVYGATKAFVHQLTLNLKADLLGTNIRVCSIEPGMCESEFSIIRFKGDTNKAKSIYAGMKPLTPTDIAETVEWIVSRPEHININTISLMPTAQAFSPFAVERNS